MIGYNPSHLNKNETLLEAFHRVEAYLKANPQYQVYQSSATYQDGTQEYSLGTIVVPEGSTVGTGDVVLFSNSYYAVIAAVYELTFSVETAVSFRGPQGPKGDKGDRGTGGAGSNPNLLINPNFAINQRRQTSYTGTQQRVYCVDRWHLYGNSTFETASKKVSLLEQYSLFWQDIENYNDLKGKTVTFSISVSNVSGNALYMKVYGGQDIHITTDGIYTVTTTLSTSITKFGCGLSRSTNETGEASCVVNWAKLEIGSVATEFSPPSIAEELLKCQRYYVQFGAKNENQEIALGQAVGSIDCKFFVVLPASLRRKPTITYDNPPIIAQGAENNSSTTSIILFGLQNNILYLGVKSSGLSQGAICRLRLENSFLYVDAEI